MDQTNSHILVISSPLQGHLSPLLKFSTQVAKLGAKITFLAPDVTLARVAKFNSWNPAIRMMSIPDCLEHSDDWKDQEKVYVHIQRVIPNLLENLLSNRCNDDGDRITGVVVDSALAWVLGIAKKFGVKVGLFWVSLAGCLALGFKIPQLLESKFFDSDGMPIRNEPIPLLPNIPAMSTSDLIWYFPDDEHKQKTLFHATKDICDHIKGADWIISNSFLELEPTLPTIAPNILSVGPLLTDGQSCGSLQLEDFTCLTWLDKHPKGSAIYVSFGSSSRLDEKQVNELALGLELTGLPFLWVLSSGLTNETSLAHTKEYIDRVADRGKIVRWAPQEAVLGHPSIGCFLSHSGWNSVMESISMGVPLLCWPYYGDQMYVRTCICDAWQIGMRLLPDEGGAIFSRLEVKRKVEELMCDGVLRENMLRLKHMARKSVDKGGTSLANLVYLVDQMKG